MTDDDHDEYNRQKRHAANFSGGGVEFPKNTQLFEISLLPANIMLDNLTNMKQQIMLQHKQILQMLG